MDKITLVKKITCNFNNIVSRNEIRKYFNLDWGDNGIGDRWCDKKLNYIVIYKGNKKSKIYTDCNEDIKTYEDKINKFKTDYNGRDVGIIGIKVLSIRTTKDIRPIRKDIKDYYKNKNCTVCGSSSEIVIDHKNDNYDDMRVLDSKTQTIDDFQPLCTHCNLQKRQVSKKEKETGILYSALNIMQLKCFEKEIKLMEKLLSDKCYSYWYDTTKYIERLKYILSNSSINEITMKTNLINL
jgi:hypothetical protein